MTKARDNATQGGLVLVNSTSFTNASSVSVNNCFSSIYQNYRIVFNVDTISSDCAFQFRMRSNGTDSSASYYGMMSRFLGAWGAYTSFNAAAFAMFSAESTVPDIYFQTIDIVNPFETKKTRMALSGSGFSINDDWRYYVGGAVHNIASSYDGFTIYPDAGTATGNIKVYGYRN